MFSNIATESQETGNRIIKEYWEKLGFNHVKDKKGIK